MGVFDSDDTSGKRRAVILKILTKCQDDLTHMVQELKSVKDFMSGGFNMSLEWLQIFGETRKVLGKELQAIGVLIGQEIKKGGKFDV